MATSIFFTESKDFKLIKERILTHEDYYLVYVYADTSNIKIPKELIKELPIYGNNLIWVDTAHFDAAAISHHMVLTVGQLIDPEEEIDFYIVSRTAKYERTVLFLRNQGIPADMITGPAEKQAVKKVKGSGKRGRPKKVQAEAPVLKKRGRPKKEKPVVEVTAEPKKRGRKKAVRTTDLAPSDKPVVKRGRKKKVITPMVEMQTEEVKISEVPVKGKNRKTAKKKVEKVKKEAKPKKADKPKKAAKPKKVAKPATPKGPKPSKPRVEKSINPEEITDKVAKFQIDGEHFQAVYKLLEVNKTKRPRFKNSLTTRVMSDNYLATESEADNIINEMKEKGLITIDETSGKISYKD